MDAVAQGKMRATEQGRGRAATRPAEVPARGWKDVLWRTYREISHDRVMFVAAGVTFFLLLSMVPSLSAFVSLYGLFTSPESVTEHSRLLSNVVPPGGMEIINEQLERLASQGSGSLGWALAISLAVALWSASAGVKAMFEAMNIAYDETEQRNFFVLSAMAVLFTLGGIVAAIIMIAVVVIIPATLGLLGLGEGTEWLVRILGYAALVVLLFVGIAAVYRFGPSRQQAKWRWITPGAVLAVAVILIVSLLFSWYASNFANYDATYGSLGALIGLLTWMWISMTIVIVGAELNAEAEHQTAHDSTVGAPTPMGTRDATVADTVGRSVEEGGDPTMDSQDAHDEEWRQGYETARQRYRPAKDGLSLGTLAFTIPAALTLHYLARRRQRGHANRF